MKSIIIALTLLSSGVALAEQQSEKISKIDGQLVKVGEKNEYEYDYKKWNLGVNAFSLPLGYIAVSGSYALTSNVVARVGAAYDTNQKNSNHSLNFGVPIYFKKAYSGFFVEPGVDTQVGIYTAGGYHWMWDSGFNIYAGAGFAKHLKTGKAGGIGMLQVAYNFDTPRF